MSPDQARELLAQLVPPYDLMARWQLYTGLRVSELLQLTLHDILKHKMARRSRPAAGHHTIRLIRKGRKHGYVIASESLFAVTDSYISLHRAAWLHRASGRDHRQADLALFIGPQGVLLIHPGNGHVPRTLRITRSFRSNSRNWPHSSITTTRPISRHEPCSIVAIGSSLNSGAN